MNFVGYQMVRESRHFVVRIHYSSTRQNKHLASTFPHTHACAHKSIQQNMYAYYTVVNAE